MQDHPQNNICVPQKKTLNVPIKEENWKGIGRFFWFQHSGSCNLEEGRQCCICQKTGADSGLLLLQAALQQVCACHNRTPMTWWGVWVPLDCGNGNIPSLGDMPPASTAVVIPSWPELQWQFFLRGAKGCCTDPFTCLQAQRDKNWTWQLKRDTLRALRHFTKWFPLLCDSVKVSHQTGRLLQSYHFHIV